MTYNLVRGWAPLRGVLVERNKYIDLPIPELYDLGADPKEERNLAPQQARRLHVLANTLRTLNVAPPNRPGRESADVAAALRSLGYISGSAPEQKSTPRRTTPSASSRSIATCTPRRSSIQDGRSMRRSRC